MINFKKNTEGFTLAELLITVLASLLILMIITSTFILNQKVVRKSNTKAELIQNGRITTDLMAREVRQAIEIVTTLPPDNSDPGLVAHELEFEDGHVTSQIQYIRYYLDNITLKRQIVVYYFETNPSTYVHWDDTDPFGLPRQTTLEEKIISEYFSSIDFYGEDIINVDIILNKSGETVEIKSNIHPRNI